MLVATFHVNILALLVFDCLSIFKLFLTHNFGFFILYFRYAEPERSPRDRDYYDYSRSDHERSRRGRSYDDITESRLVWEILPVWKWYLNFPYV